MVMQYGRLGRRNNSVSRVTALHLRITWGRRWLCLDSPQFGGCKTPQCVPHTYSVVWVWWWCWCGSQCATYSVVVAYTVHTHIVWWWCGLYSVQTLVWCGSGSVSGRPIPHTPSPPSCSGPPCIMSHIFHFNLDTLLVKTMQVLKRDKFYILQTPLPP